MLHPSTPVHGVAVGTYQSPPVRDRASFTWLLEVIRKRRWTIILVTMVVFGTGALYVFSATPRYTATARLATDTHRPQSGMNQIGAPVDLAVIESQIETIKSEKIVNAAIARLGLETDPELRQRNFLAKTMLRLGIRRTNEGENNPDVIRRRILHEVERSWNPRPRSTEAMRK